MIYLTGGRSLDAGFALFRISLIKKFLYLFGKRCLRHRWEEHGISDLLLALADDTTDDDREALGHRVGDFFKWPVVLTPEFLISIIACAG